ncbi:MAG: hypothetical protein M0Z80_00325 [Treponema sp.]|nr:hypothetical protein [Treponema sp.]
MKVVLKLIGALACVAGAVALLDGFKVIHLSFLSGGRRWILGGVLLLVVGIVLLARRGSKKTA